MNAASPHSIMVGVDKNAANPCAVTAMQGGERWRFSRLRRCKFLNTIVAQDAGVLDA
jgi:hypothetical protein